LRLPLEARGILKEAVPLLLANKDLLGELVETVLPTSEVEPAVLPGFFVLFLLAPRVGAFAVASGFGGVSGGSGILGGFGALNKHIINSPRCCQ
tara:strand:+ start:246 stop:527 length:282 start_codon:yes stop_codon:yes gene_type:complete